jgi:YVTN family beta-propeller protein
MGAFSSAEDSALELTFGSVSARSSLMPEHRGGTVTFVFTDIEGSTRLVQEFKERWPEVRSVHRRIVREAFEAHGGDEVDTQGDSFFYVFGRARDAALAAADAQRGLAEHDWPEAGRVRIRIGMHTGEPVVSEEGYHGIGVHRAARIMAAGHGGQVLLSEATAAVLRDEEISGLGLRDLGVHRLKDLERPEHVYQLVAQGLETSFAKIRTAGEQRLPYRRPLVIGAAAGVLAAAVAIPVFAFAGGSGGGGSLAAVDDNSVGVVDPGSRSITSEASDIQSPAGVAAGGGAVWVTSNASSGSVVRIDPSTHQVQQRITVGSGPEGVAVSGNDVWVVNAQEGSVSRVSTTETSSVLQTIAVGNAPTSVAVGNGNVWVTNAGDGTISQLNARSGKRARTIPVGSPVHGIAYGAGKLWVTDPVGNQLVEVSPGSGVVTRVGVGSGPSAVVYGDGAVWVANNLDGTVSRVDPSADRVTAAYTVGAAPNGLAVTPREVWVTDEVNGTISRIDVSSGAVTHTMLGGRPEGVAAAGGSLWVAVQAAGDAHRGGTLRTVSAMDFGVDTIDPQLSYFVSDWQLLSATNDGLVGFKRVGGSDGDTVVPDLAMNLPQPSADGKTWTFRLRQGIRFSNGHELRASDVRSSFERIFKVGGPRLDFYAGIVGGAACQKHANKCDLSHGILVDDQAGTVTFKLAAPDPDFLYKLALPLAAILPAGTSSRVPVPATGPYEIAVYKKNRFIRLVSNPSFHVWSRAAQPEGVPDVIELRTGGTPDSGFRAVERGRADWTPEIPMGQVQSARIQFPAQLHVTPSTSTFILSLNTRRPPFNDERARKALAYGFDRNRVVADLGGKDVAVPACVLLPPNFPSYRPYCPYVAKPGIPDSGPDLARARALVRQSGTKGDVVKTMKVITSPGPFAPLNAELVRTLRALGYRSSVLKVKDVAEMFEHIYGVQLVDAAGSGWTADYPAPSNFFSGVLACVQLKLVCDRALDRRMQQLSAVATHDPQRASEGWAKLDQEVTSRALIIPIASPRVIDFVSKRLGNFQYHPVFGLLIDQAWVR